MKSRGPPRLVVCGIFALVAGLSLTAFIKLPSFFRALVESRSGLQNGTLAADLFGSIPFEIHQNVYMFNITNQDEFFSGGKPHFQQLGPYVFSVSLHKEMSWSSGDLLSYRENRKFFFDSNLSNGSLSDPIYTIDPVYASAQEAIEKLPAVLQDLIRPFLQSRKIIFKHSVGELLYDGYTDELAKLAHLVKPDLPVIDGRIGYLRMLNDTDDGYLTVYAGIDDATRSRRNFIVQWRSRETIPYYSGRCNRLWGTNAELFPSFSRSSPPANVGIFLAPLCRPWSLRVNGTRLENGVELVRFASGVDIFSPKTSHDAADCKQLDGWPRGLFDVRACQHGFPALISLPHFLYAEEKLLSDVDGLQPDITQHNFHIDIHPLLGIPLRPAIRVQLSVRIQRHFKAAGPDNPPIVYPVLWQELVLAESSILYLSSTIFYGIQLPLNILRGMAMALFIVSLVLIPLYLFGFCRKVREDDTEPIVSSTADATSSNE